MAPSKNPSKDCPACGKDIGFAAVFFSAHPWSIQCPHCSARLGYAGGQAAMVLLLLAGMAAVWYAWTLTQRYGPGGWGNFVMWLAMCLLAWLPLEAGVSLFMRLFGTLQRSSS